MCWTWCRYRNVLSLCVSQRMPLQQTTFENIVAKWAIYPNYHIVFNFIQLLHIHFERCSICLPRCFQRHLMRIWGKVIRYIDFSFLVPNYRYPSMNYLLLTVYVLVSIGGVCSQTGTDAKNLRTQLFVTDAYDKKIFPSLDQSYIKGNVLHGTFRYCYFSHPNRTYRRTLL